MTFYVPPPAGTRRGASPRVVAGEAEPRFHSVSKAAEAAGQADPAVPAGGQPGTCTRTPTGAGAAAATA